MTIMRWILKGFRMVIAPAMAFILVNIAAGATSALADKPPVYLFLTSTNEDAATLAALATLEGYLKSGMGQDMPDRKVKVIAQHTLVSTYNGDVNEYVMHHQVDDYMHARVLSAGSSGFSIEMSLKTAVKADPIVELLIGGQEEDLLAMINQLDPFLVLMQAMVEGFPPESVVFVGCFSSEPPDHGTRKAVAKTVTLRLPADLHRGGLGNRRLWMHGVDQAAFVAFCTPDGGPPPHYRVSQYRISGTISKAEEDNNEISDVAILISTKRKRGRAAAFHQAAILPGVRHQKILRALVHCIRTNWGNWQSEDWQCPAVPQVTN